MDFWSRMLPSSYSYSDSYQQMRWLAFEKFYIAELTYEKACLVVDNIVRYSFKNGIQDGRINLAGGEPLLCKYLDELIDYLMLAE